MNQECFKTYNRSLVLVLTDIHPLNNNYCKVPKLSDAKNLCCNLPKIQTKRPNLRVFYQSDANGIANSEDPDQTAPLGAVWSGSALFAQTYQSENLGALQ